MNFARILVFVAVLTAAMLVFLYWRGADDESGKVSVPTTVSPGMAESTESEQAAPVQDFVSPEPVAEPGCWTIRSFSELPALAEDLARLKSMSAHGVALDAYRSFDETILRGFADQGDSAAMALIRAMNVMQAYEKDAALASDWINREYPIADLENPQQELTPAASMALNDAAYWFYQSALHGRLFSLQEYGQVRSRLFGGPVGLGWLSQEEFDALTPGEKSSLAPARLYEQVAYDIVPALREGFLAYIMKVNLPQRQNDVQRAIRREIVADFDRTLTESGRQPISVTPTAMPEFGDFVDQICASELQSPQP